MVRNQTNMKKTLMFAISLAAAMSASATMLVNRGLPTENLNNVADGNRANVSWAFTEYTPSDYWLVGDTFQNTSSQAWDINTIQLWSVGDTTAPYLRGGLDGSTIGIVSSTYSMTSVNYADGSQFLYQGSGGGYVGINQIDFAVNITLLPGQTYDFFLDGTGNSELDFQGNPIVVPYVHASNAALSGSPQDGADNTMLYAEVINGSIPLGYVGTWSSLGDGWDKASDVNVQVFGSAVPEPTTVIAGALLLLPFGASTLRSLRRNRTA